MICFVPRPIQEGENGPDGFRGKWWAYSCKFKFFSMIWKPHGLRSYHDGAWKSGAANRHRAPKNPPVFSPQSHSLSVKQRDFKLPPFIMMKHRVRRGQEAVTDSDTQREPLLRMLKLHAQAFRPIYTSSIVLFFSGN